MDAAGARALKERIEAHQAASRRRAERLALRATRGEQAETGGRSPAVPPAQAESSRPKNDP